MPGAHDLEGGGCPPRPLFRGRCPGCQCPDLVVVCVLLQKTRQCNTTLFDIRTRSISAAHADAVDAVRSVQVCRSGVWTTGAPLLIRSEDDSFHSGARMAAVSMPGGMRADERRTERHVHYFSKIRCVSKKDPQHF